MSFAVRHAAGRLRLVGNAALTSTRAGVTAVRRAADSGVDLVMVRPWGIGEAGQDALFDALAEVCASSPVGCVIQDAPQNTGVTLQPGTLARLLTEAPGVAAVKVEPRPSAPKIGAIVEALHGRPGTVIGGAGASELIFELDRGAKGTMPGPAFADVLGDVCRLYAEGRRGEAAALFRDFLPLAALGRGMAGFLFGQKYILRARGVLDEPLLRAPHAPIDPRLPGDIDALLEAPALRRAMAFRLGGAEAGRR
jgi:4-hydroxy-tetrahydrodipicolinate synthase